MDNKLPFSIEATNSTVGDYKLVAQFKYYLDALDFLEAQKDAFNTTWILIGYGEYRSMWRRGRPVDQTRRSKPVDQTDYRNERES